MKKFLLSVALLVSVLGAQCFANTAAVTTSPTSSDVYEINNATPGTRKVNLGYRLQGLLQTNATTASTSDSTSLVCSSAGYSSPYTRTYIKSITSGAHGDAYCLGDGYQGQHLTFLLKSTTGAQKFRISPYTKTGFTSIDLTAANGSVTLVFSDSTNGWVVSGTTYTSVTIN